MLLDKHFIVVFCSAVSKKKKSTSVLCSNKKWKIKHCRLTFFFPLVLVHIVLLSVFEKDLGKKYEGSTGKNKNDQGNGKKRSS